MRWIKKTFGLQKIPHTEDTESLNQCGEKTDTKKSYDKYKNLTTELKFSTGHHLQMLANGCKWSHSPKSATQAIKFFFASLEIQKGTNGRY